MDACKRVPNKSNSTVGAVQVEANLYKQLSDGTCGTREGKSAQTA